MGSAGLIVFLILIARYRINLPSRSIERYIEQVRTGEQPHFPERTDWDFEIRLDPVGVAVVPIKNSAEPPSSLTWDSIIEATAFKRDLFSTDRVCIAFHSSNGSGVEVHEEMKGWIELCEALPDHLPGSPPWTDWFMKITTPAFELNPTLLFCRGKADALL
jgi:hypothetical protein